MLCLECICQTLSELNLIFDLCRIHCMRLILLAGFNPIHLVVRQTDEVDAIPTDEHSDIESSPARVLEETPLANAPDDLIHLPEDFPESPGALSYGKTGTESLPSDEPDSFSKDIGVQCDLVDVLALLAEHQRNANDEDMPWFVSAMNMAREDTGTYVVSLLIKTYSSLNLSTSSVISSVLSQMPFSDWLCYSLAILL